MTTPKRWTVEGVEVDTPSAGFCEGRGQRCPVCHGENILHRRPRNCEGNETLLERRAKCKDCKAEWTAVFRLNRYSELGIPAKTAEARKGAD